MIHSIDFVVAYDIANLQSFGRIVIITLTDRQRHSDSVPPLTEIPADWFTLTF